MKKQTAKKEKTFNREIYYQKETKVDEFGEEYEVVIYPFRGRVAEFRFLYPEGRIVNEIVAERSSSNFTVYKCSIYLGKNDTLPVAVATATRDLDASSEFGRRFYECAETAAVVRALRLVGIGLEFAEDDPTIPEQIVSKETTVQKKPKTIKVRTKTVKTDSKAPLEENSKEISEVKSEEHVAQDQSAESENGDYSKEEKEASSEKLEVIVDPEESEVNDDKLLNIVISTTKSKALKGKTFAEAISMAKDMNAFKRFLNDLEKKGTDDEKKAADRLLKTLF